MPTQAAEQIKSLSSFVWSIAELLRGDFKQSEYGNVILPLVVLRRLDCILETSKAEVLRTAESLPSGIDDAAKDLMLLGAVGESVKVYNLSRFTLETLKNQDPGQLYDNLVEYVTKFSANVRDIFIEKFLFIDQLKRLRDSKILWPVFERFAQIDLHRNAVSNLEMGYLFEELIRRFSEISNETAGEHFTYGVWYGSESVETTAYESAYHWYKGLLCDAGYERQGVTAEREVYRVACGAALLDFRKASHKHPDLLHPSDYAFCQSVGARIHREGHPGLLTPSVRRPTGENTAIFNPDMLSNPRLDCQLTYRLDGDQIVVEKQPGAAWLTLAVASFA